MEKRLYKVVYSMEEGNWWYRGNRKIVFSLLNKFLPRKKRLNILDAGCGTGVNLKYLRRYGKVTGLDASDDAIRFCKKRGCKIIKGSVEKLPFKSESFDLVTCFEVLYHKNVKKDITALKEFYRVLRPGGILIIRDPAFRFLMSEHDRLVHTRERYNIGIVKKNVLRAGFKVKKISYVNSILFPFVLLLKVFKAGLGSGKSDIEGTPKILNGFLAFVFRIEAFFIRFVNFPCGSSIICVAKK